MGSDAAQDRVKQCALHSKTHGQITRGPVGRVCCFEAVKRGDGPACAASLGNAMTALCNVLHFLLGVVHHAACLHLQSEQTVK